MAEVPHERPDLLRSGVFSYGPLSTICNVANRVQCGWIEVHVGAGFKPALAQQTRTIRWQRGYYEHVVRNEKALDRIRAYIANNPARWADDPENISRAVPAETGRV